MNTSYEGAQIVPFKPSDEDAWMRDSVCAYADLAPMYPDPEDHETEAYAKSLCARCPVVAECLAHAFDKGERYGIWGGTNPDERRAMKRAEYNRTQRAAARRVA